MPAAGATSRTPHARHDRAVRPDATETGTDERCTVWSQTARSTVGSMRFGTKPHVLRGGPHGRRPRSAASEDPWSPARPSNRIRHARGEDDEVPADLRERTDAHRVVGSGWPNHPRRGTRRATIRCTRESRARRTAGRDPRAMDPRGRPGGLAPVDRTRGPTCRSPTHRPNRTSRVNRGRPPRSRPGVPTRTAGTRRHRRHLRPRRPQDRPVSRTPTASPRRTRRRTPTPPARRRRTAKRCPTPRPPPSRPPSASVATPAGWRASQHTSSTPSSPAWPRSPRGWP